MGQFFSSVSQGAAAVQRCKETDTSCRGLVTWVRLSVGWNLVFSYGVNPISDWWVFRRVGLTSTDCLVKEPV